MRSTVSARPAAQAGLSPHGPRPAALPALTAPGKPLRRRVTALLMAAITLLASFAAGVTASALAPAVAFAATGTGYVASIIDNTATPIDLAAGTAGTPIAAGFQPAGIALTPDGGTVYVVNGGDDTVTPIDTATNTAGTAITVGSRPFGIAITPDGATAYVTNSDASSVTPITTATNTAGSAIAVGFAPHGIAITPDGATAYVANSAGASVTPITLASGTAGTAIAVGSGPEDVAITPDGATAYVSRTIGNTVTPITVATNTVGTPIATGGSLPTALAITPNGATLYTANRASNTVTPITIATGTAGTPIAVGSSPRDLAVTADGTTVYVTNLFSNTVTPISTATNTTGTSITVNRPSAIALPTGVPTADIDVNLAAQPHLGILVPYLKYTLSAANTGPDPVTSATLTATLPAGATATNLSPGCSIAATTVTCTYGAIANGASVDKSFRVPLSLLSLGNVTVTAARTTSAPNDPNPANDNASATCTVISIILVTCP
ncbi:beta-propeller fold lactonase family protein [Nonomuraea endophytica]|uniref:beta-propeller fold lactonase family protein n=1 Tax=Nonomuraea endophytica TaxID=714136 RepID=UPI0037C645DF